MATGITKREQKGASAKIAVGTADHNGLPEPREPAVLHYPHRMLESALLAPRTTAFKAATKSGKPIRTVIAPNCLTLADNMRVLETMLAAGHKVTLIYLDPPYNTGMGFQNRELSHSYDDSRGTAAYVEYMRRRLILMRELLSDDGSIYLHIGHQMLGHLKVVMDEIFGAENFRNIITRRKCSSKNYTTRQFANIHDYVLFYTKGPKYKWNQPGEKPSEEWLEKEYPKKDARGRYKLVPIHAPGTRNGPSGSPWRGKMPPPGKHWQYVPATLDEIDEAGEMHWSRNGNPRRKVYLSADKSIPYTDYWAGFRDAHHQSIAVTGYPTEKNGAMLQMIVKASSNPGDLVMDPFCGSGTTLAAAETLGRRWIGVDESFVAIHAALKRFRKGVRPMGDFVKSAAKTEMLDLFGETEGEIAKAGVTTPVDFDFIVDETLLAEHEQEIRQLAEI